MRALSNVTTFDLLRLPWYALLTACDVAQGVPRLFGQHRVQLLPVPVAVLMRAVLLGSAKCLYVLGPDETAARQVRLLRLANVELQDEIRGLQAATVLNAADPEADYSARLQECSNAQQQVRGELIRRGYTEGSAVNETELLEAAEEILLKLPTNAHMPKLTKMLWSELSGVSHARAWHRDSFDNVYSADYRTLQLLVPARAYLNTAWELWHQRRGAPGGPYEA